MGNRPLLCKNEELGQRSADDLRGNQASVIEFFLQFLSRISSWDCSMDHSLRLKPIPCANPIRKERVGVNPRRSIKRCVGLEGFEHSINPMEFSPESIWQLRINLFQSVVLTNWVYLIPPYRGAHGCWKECPLSEKMLRKKRCLSPWQKRGKKLSTCYFLRLPITSNSSCESSHKKKLKKWLRSKSSDVCAVIHKVSTLKMVG